MLNKNAIPFDPQPPSIASGIRVGTPAVTTQGMTEGDMKEVASLIGRAVRDADGAGRRRSPPVSASWWPRTPPTRRPGQLTPCASTPSSCSPPRRHVPGHPGGADGRHPARMMAAPRDRDVHVIPTPRLGGVAMYLGVAAAMLVATRLPALQRTFDDSQTVAVLVAGGLICPLGVLDDKWGLDALTKLTGQIAAAGVMVLLGVQLAFLFLPVADIGTLILGPRRRRPADHPADRRSR